MIEASSAVSNEMDDMIASHLDEEKLIDPYCARMIRCDVSIDVTFATRKELLKKEIGRRNVFYLV